MEDLVALGRDILGGSSTLISELENLVRKEQKDLSARPERQERCLYISAWLGLWDIVAEAASSPHESVRRCAVGLLADSFRDEYDNIPIRLLRDDAFSVRRAAETVVRLNGGRKAVEVRAGLGI